MRIWNRTQVFEWYHIQWPWVTSNLDFKVTVFSRSNNSITVQDRAIGAMADWQKFACDLLKCAISNDLQLPITQISGTHHYSTLDVPETVKDRDIVSMEYYRDFRQALPNGVISEWPVVTLSDSKIFNDMKHRATSLDSWATCFAYGLRNFNI